MSIEILLLLFILMWGGIYLMMKRHLMEVLLGLLLLSHAVNMFLILMGGWSATALPPLLSSGSKRPEDYADPVPQALILTAIVIGFAMLAYLAVLVLRGYEDTGDIHLAEKSGEEDAH